MANKKLEQQWRGSCARLKGHEGANRGILGEEGELHLSNLTLCQASVDFLNKQSTALQEEIGARNDDCGMVVKPFKSLFLSGCGFEDSTTLERFCDWIGKTISNKITIAHRQSNPVIQQQTRRPADLVLVPSLQDVELILKEGVMGPSSSVESVVLRDCVLVQERTIDSTLVPAALRELLSTPRVRDFGLVGCHVNVGAAEVIAAGIQDNPRGLRTLLLENCKMEADATALLVNSTSPNWEKDRLSGLSSPLEALTVTFRSFDDLFVNMLVQVLNTHRNLKCLGANTRAVWQPTSSYRGACLPAFLEALRKHTHLQSLDCYPMLTPSRTVYTLLRRNYYLWRMGYLCSSQTPPLEAVVWPTLLGRIGNCGPLDDAYHQDGSAVFHFLRYNVEALQQRPDRGDYIATNVRAVCEQATCNRNGEKASCNHPNKAAPVLVKSTGRPPTTATVALQKDLAEEPVLRASSGTSKWRRCLTYLCVGVFVWLCLNKKASKECAD